MPAPTVLFFEYLYDVHVKSIDSCRGEQVASKRTACLLSKPRFASKSETDSQTKFGQENENQYKTQSEVTVLVQEVEFETGNNIVQIKR